MNEPLLDIIVTHYDEPWEIGERLFRMIAMQDRVLPEDVQVTAVHDGELAERISREQLGDFPFRFRQVRMKHNGGVSAARNAGFASTNGRWVMFCDWDDHFSSTDALWLILREIIRDDADVIMCHMTNESAGDGRIEATELTENYVFVHAKAFRREFLNHAGISFATDVGFSEDTLFCETVKIAVNPARVRVIPRCVYTRTFREGSICHSEERNTANCASLFRARRHMTEEYRRRNCPKNFAAKVCRTIADYFFATNDPNYPERERFEQGFAEYYRDYGDVFERTCLTDKNLIAWAYNESRSEAVHKGILTVENTTLWDWLDRMDRRYGIHTDKPLTEKTGADGTEPGETGDTDEEVVLPPDHPHPLKLTKISYPMEVTQP